MPHARPEPTRSRRTVWLDNAALAALDAIHQRDGVLPSEQIRRAVLAWVERRGIKVTKTGRPRVTARKHP